MKNTAFMTKKIFFALGTVCSLTVYDSNAHTALERCKNRVMEIHNRMNAYDENSEISRINAMAGKDFVRVSEDTLSLIEASIGYANLTNGMYDITTRPASNLWKRAIVAGVMPQPQQIAHAAGLTDYHSIYIDRKNSAVFLRRSGQEIDLGAIAKGYAADEVRRILKEEHIKQAIINLGGTVVNIGMKRRIGIQNPFERTGVSFAYVDVANKAIVSSGLYEQGVMIDGRLCHHIIDPLTGAPAETELSGVTLIGDRAEVLDALSTAVFMMGIAESLSLLEERGIEAVFVTKEGSVYTTNGLNQRYAQAG